MLYANETVVAIVDVLDTLAFMKRKCPESFQRSDSGGFTVQMVMDQFVRRNKVGIE